MDDLGCPFRKGIQVTDQGELAECHFAARLTGANPRHCVVDRSACEVCIEGAPLSPVTINPVMPSVILNACEVSFDAPEPETIPGVLKAWAERAVNHDSIDVTVPTIHACDLVLDARGVTSASKLEQTIAGSLDQVDTHVILHVLTDSSIHALRSQSTNLTDLLARPNVHTQRLDQPSDLGEILNQIIVRSETPSLAFVDGHCLQRSTRLKRSLQHLHDRGTELVFAHCESCDGMVHRSFLSEQAATLQLATMVIRRAALVDLGGFDATVGDACLEELLRRVIRLGRPIHLAEEVLCRIDTQERGDAAFIGALNFDVPSEPITQRVSARLVRDRARCDVVIPFRDGFNFAAEAIDSIVTQRNAEVILHLVDDASLESSNELLNRYRNLPNVRLYRNERNIGPFATFNNLMEFVKTDFVAVQDADDISLPDRIAHSYALMQSTRADLLTGATELFGESSLVDKICWDYFTVDECEWLPLRFSRYACQYTSGYYMENPTLVVRRPSFIALGGYGDFGERNRNRTGVDTDLQLRAYHARSSIAVTRDVVVRYRCHGISATQHDDSGIGSRANRESTEEVLRRLKLYAQGSFDARWFGALDLYRGVTRPLSPSD
ncbi:glycosyltransferase family A protein [Roseiconus lacunae]|uniref:Glycosyltransferase family A protein n=1 Tax=Roseiconus lacunae TaxID=2605694 RepID=A0ABT7PPQ6_9BACT|nr:glycosyltransferase family A protein [Roseiconus lacunae]MDM4018323.1 glycosyltransferase family A protein [Roseiconus lacunae]